MCRPEAWNPEALSFGRYRVDYPLGENNWWCRLVGHWWKRYQSFSYARWEGDPPGSVRHGPRVPPWQRTCQLCGLTERLGAEQWPDGHPRPPGYDYERKILPLEVTTDVDGPYNPRNWEVQDG